MLKNPSWKSKTGRGKVLPLLKYQRWRVKRQKGKKKVGDGSCIYVKRKTDWEFLNKVAISRQEKVFLGDVGWILMYRPWTVSQLHLLGCEFLDGKRTLLIYLIMFKIGLYTEYLVFIKLQCLLKRTVVDNKLRTGCNLSVHQEGTG